MSEPFEISPFMPAVTEAFDNDFNVMNSRLERGQADTDASFGLPSEKENSTRENNVAKIKVVVCFLLSTSAFLWLCVFQL